MFHYLLSPPFPGESMTHSNTHHPQNLSGQLGWGFLGAVVQNGKHFQMLQNEAQMFPVSSIMVIISMPYIAKCINKKQGLFYCPASSSKRTTWHYLMLFRLKWNVTDSICVWFNWRTREHFLHTNRTETNILYCQDQTFYKEKTVHPWILFCFLWCVY